jgi:hypothetical protein
MDAAWPVLERVMWFIGNFEASGQDKKPAVQAIREYLVHVVRTSVNANERRAVDLACLDIDDHDN